MARISWPEVVERAAAIAGSYSTPVTLRQLFYRLVSEQLLPNKDTSYKTLSARTAEARRDGWFPRLLDQNRRIENLWSYDDPAEAVTRLARSYRRDRTEGQKQVPWVVLEKKTLVEQVLQWVDEYAIPVVVLGGYGSQEIKFDVLDQADLDDRPAVAIYIGDLDPSGADIERDFEERTDLRFDRVERIAVTFEQIDQYGLVPAPGKATDSRAAGFEATYGQLIQVEVEAIEPRTLEGLVRSAVEDYVDFEQLGRVREVEDRERMLLFDAARQLADAAEALDGTE